MKTNKRPKQSVTKPLLKELVDRQKANLKVQTQNPSIGSKPCNRPALFEDPGMGYNPDFTFPQD